MHTLPLPVIRRLVPLKGLQDHALQILLDNSECRLVARGQRLFAPAALQQSWFYVLSGSARLDYCIGGRVASVLHDAGQCYPVSYGLSGLQAATAEEDCLCLRIDRPLLDKQLCWHHVASAIELDISYRPEHDEEVAWMLTLLRSNLFVKVPPLNVDQIFTRLRPMQVKAGEVILQQGNSGDDGCYFIRRGSAKVTRRLPGESAERHLADIGVGRCFGEDALVYDTVRNATVTMTSDGQLMRLDKSDFMLLLREPEIEHVKAADLASELAAHGGLIDVRLPEEFAVAHLAQADNMPLACLRLQMARTLDRHHSYIVCCDTGRRSRAAAYLLQQHGFRARYLLNGMASLDQHQRETWLQQMPPLPPALPDLPVARFA